MGSSPAQSHSTRHTHAATNPVGHSGDGFEPCAHPTGSPATREVLRPHCCVISATRSCVTSLPQSRGSQAQLPPGGAEQPETKRRWRLGSMGNVLFQQSCLPRWGWLGEVPRPSATTSSRGSPQPASESEEHRNNGGRRGERRGRGPSQTKALRLHPRPPSFLQVFFLDPRSPQGAQHSLTGGKEDDTGSGRIL